MRAYLKFALILALAVLIDRAAFAPQRYATAIEREAIEDWPRCSSEINARMIELAQTADSDGDPHHLENCFKIATDEHLRHCTRSHLAEQDKRRRAQPDRPLYTRLFDTLRFGLNDVFG